MIDGRIQTISLAMIFFHLYKLWIHMEHHCLNYAGIVHLAILATIRQLHQSDKGFVHCQQSRMKLFDREGGSLLD